MVDENKQTGNVFSADDPLDINELASLNDDISPEFIEQLQNKVSLNAQEFTGKPVTLDKDDSELFEEVNQESSDNNFDSETFKENINDNFVKKYKAKIEKEEHSTESEDEEVNKKITPQQTTTNETSDIEDSSAQTTVQEPAPKTEKNKKKE